MTNLEFARVRREFNVTFEAHLPRAWVGRYCPVRVAGGVLWPASVWPEPGLDDLVPLVFRGLLHHVMVSQHRLGRLRVCVDCHWQRGQLGARTAREWAADTGILPAMPAAEWRAAAHPDNFTLAGPRVELTCMPAELLPLVPWLVSRIESRDVGNPALLQPAPVPLSPSWSWAPLGDNNVWTVAAWAPIQAEYAATLRSRSRRRRSSTKAGSARGRCL